MKINVQLLQLATLLVAIIGYSYPAPTGSRECHPQFGGPQALSLNELKPGDKVEVVTKAISPRLKFCRVQGIVRLVDPSSHTIEFHDNRWFIFEEILLLALHEPQSASAETRHASYGKPIEFGHLSPGDHVSFQAKGLNLDAATSREYVIVEVDHSNDRIRIADGRYFWKKEISDVRLRLRPLQIRLSEIRPGDQIGMIFRYWELSYSDPSNMYKRGSVLYVEADSGLITLIDRRSYRAGDIVGFYLLKRPRVYLPDT